MSTDEHTKFFLDQLHTMTVRDKTDQVSMYEVGSNIGLERAEAGSLAEELIIQGLVELKTLAGGIGITTAGLEFLGVSLPPERGSDEHPKLSGEHILTEDDLALLVDLLPLIKKTISRNQVEFVILEELVFDLKTIEVQLLSPKPKISVVKPLLQSIEQILRGIKADTAAEAVAAVLR